MGLFSRKKSNSDVQDENMSTADTLSGSISNDSKNAEAPRKKSLYAKYQDLKRGPGNGLSDEDLKKYTGMDRAEFDKYKATAPGVAGGQRAGAVTAGGTSGFGLAMGAGEGLGGWGHKSNKDPVVR